MPLSRKKTKVRGQRIEWLKTHWKTQSERTPPGQHWAIPEIAPALLLFPQLRRYSLAYPGARGRSVEE